MDNIGGGLQNKNSPDRALIPTILSRFYFCIYIREQV